MPLIWKHRNDRKIAQQRSHEYLTVLLSFVVLLENMIPHNTPGEEMNYTSMLIKPYPFICFYFMLSHYFSNHTGGSYKKIGYYDSSQKNLSWFGNDIWIGKIMTLSSLSFLCVCLCPVLSCCESAGSLPCAATLRPPRMWLNLDAHTVLIIYNHAGFSLTAGLGEASYLVADASPKWAACTLIVQHVLKCCRRRCTGIKQGWSGLWLAHLGVFSVGGGEPPQTKSVTPPVSQLSYTTRAVFFFFFFSFC